MAIIKLGEGVAAASGSLGGVTFSRNRGGPYIRRRVVPVNPNTVQQQVIRSLVSQLTSLWLTTLTAVQRESWDTYANQVPLPNPLGALINVGGLGMYVRSNVPRLQTALPRVDAAPVEFNLGDFTAPIITTLVAPNVLTLAFTILDDWVNEDDAALLVFGGRGQNDSINFFKGPYRTFPGVLGDATTPPTSPEVLTWPFTLSIAQRGFLRVRVTRKDGRLSADARTFRVVT